MFTTGNAFEQELKKRLVEEMARVTEMLTSAAGVRDMADYKYLTGQLFAYRRVIDDYFGEVATTLSKR